MTSSFFHVAARAGAGTGKTYSLVENYVSALLGLDPSGIKKRPQNILALTFTQKAANEMRLRVAARLLELIGEHNSFDKDELRRLLRALPNASIATFHGFCATILRQEAQSLGLDDLFEILPPHEELRLARNILRPLVMAQVEKPDPVVRSLVARFRLGQGLLSLGLIDGLIECYGKLAELGALGDQLDHSRAAISLDTLRRDLHNIEQALADFEALDSTDSTTRRLVEIRSAYANLASELGPLREAELAASWTHLRQAIKGNFGDKSARQNLLAQVITLGAHVVDYFVAQDEGALASLLRDFHRHFERAKLEQNKLSYADLLLKTRTALGEKPELRARLKARFAHILVDEYQDTSPIQEQIIVLIAENKSCGHILPANVPLENLDLRNGASLFVVGDKKQSIYGFRGADTKLFDRMIHRMALTHENTQGFTQKLLTINRRSRPKLLSLINLVSQHSLAAQGYDQQEDLEAWHRDNPGLAELWVSGDDQGLDKTSANLAACTQGVTELLGNRPDLRPSDIVILVRRIKSANPIKEQLGSLGISARIVGGDGFFQQQEVVDLIAALKLINDPAHELASAIVLRSPLVLVPDADLLTMCSKQQKLNLATAKLALEAGQISGAACVRLENFLQALNDIKREITDHGLAWALDILVARTDLAFSLGLGDNPEQAWANINKLRALTAGVNKNPHALIEEYFDYIANNFKEPQALGIQDDHLVTIMTIHQSKGLEFKVVVLADGESIVPHNGSDFLYDQGLGLVVKPKGRPVAACAPSGRDEQELCPTRFDVAKNKLSRSEQAELARLLYVALTRAQEELYVVSSKATFIAPGGSTSLLGLFLGAMQQRSADFLALCPIRHLGERPVLATPQCKPDVPAPAWQVYQPGKPTLRCFSSQLVAPPEWRFLPHINQDVGSARPGIDGNLAHQILALAGDMLGAFADPDESTIDHVINASFRAQPIYADPFKAKLTQEACRTTLKVLQAELIQAERAIFEMPLYTWPTPKMVIEGFADLVIEMPDFIGVLEFKSSHRLAIHENTYLQIFAYAQALADQSSKPVKYAIILVGSPKAVWWRDYDENCRQALAEAIGVLPALSGCEVISWN